MTLKTFYEALTKQIESNPSTLNLEVKIEYPFERVYSKIAPVQWMDYDESDFIISYLSPYGLENN